LLAMALSGGDPDTLIHAASLKHQGSWMSRGSKRRSRMQMLGKIVRSVPASTDARRGSKQDAEAPSDHGSEVDDDLAEGRVRGSSASERKLTAARFIARAKARRSTINRSITRAPTRKSTRSITRRGSSSTKDPNELKREATAASVALHMSCVGALSDQLDIEAIPSPCRRPSPSRRAKFPVEPVGFPLAPVILEEQSRRTSDSNVAVLIDTSSELINTSSESSESETLASTTAGFFNKVAALRAYMRTAETIDVPVAVLGWRESLSLPPSSSSLLEQVDELLCTIVLKSASGVRSGPGPTLTEPSKKRASVRKDSVSLPSGWPPSRPCQPAVSRRSMPLSSGAMSACFEATLGSPQSAPVRPVASEWLARETADVEIVADHDVVSTSACSPRAAMCERV